MERVESRKEDGVPLSLLGESVMNDLLAQTRDCSVSLQLLCFPICCLQNTRCLYEGTFAKSVSQVKERGSKASNVLELGNELR